MPKPPSAPERRWPYWASMILTTVFLGGITVAFVLVVLPQRFVLQGDLRASGVSFPSSSPAFSPAEVRMRPPPPSPGLSPTPAPGPAEVLWEEVLPLLTRGEYRRAIPVLGEYLDTHPEDVFVQLEYAITLVRVGRTGEAEDAFRKVLRASENTRARLELARILGARGAWEEALWIIAAIPTGTPESTEAVALAGEIEALLSRAREAVADEAPASVPAELAGGMESREASLPSMDPLAVARQSIRDGDLGLARTLYLTALRASPRDEGLLLEWADVLQFQIEDFEGALEVLLRRGELIDPTAAERLRVAQLMIWTGSDDDVEEELIGALADDPNLSEAWALLGELHRWGARRAQAANAYGRALALDPSDPVAVEGRALLTEDTRRAVIEVDDRRFGPAVTLFRDSDGFERAQAEAYASLLPLPEVLEVRVAFRRLEGPDGRGRRGADEGGVLEGTAAKWWNEGQFRGSVTLGVERSSLAGVDAVFGVRLQARDLQGWNFDASFRSGPGHLITSTLESAAAGIRSDQLVLSYYRGLPAGFELSGALEGTRLDGGGTDDVMRFATGAAVTRGLGRWLRSGISSRYIRYSDAAPSTGLRPLFWDPDLFWSTGVLLEAGTTSVSGNGVSWYARVTPGLALAGERTAGSREWVRQLETEVGLRFQRRSLAVVLDGFYTRGREGDYTSHGLTLGFEVTR